MQIKTVTVIGANGIMGANISGIFASFGNATVYMVGRDLEKIGLAREQAAKSVKADKIADNLVVADYSMLEKIIPESDLVFESVAEDLQIKTEVYQKVIPYLKKDAIVCTGTSSLSVDYFAKLMPEALRPRFFGVHFFNPPYNMPLCELIAAEGSDLLLLQEFEQYLCSVLVRKVVPVKNAPAFLANRIGFQLINHALCYAETYMDKGGIDYVDAVIGPFTGRSMPPLLTADFVGLDIHKAIVDNLYENTNDLFNETFKLPAFAERLVFENKLGRKTKGGLYKTELIEGQKVRMIYDVKTNGYREITKYEIPFAEKMKQQLRNGDYTDAFKTLVFENSADSKFCLKLLVEYIVYSVLTAEKIGYSIKAADTVMAEGFNWCPPLALAGALSTVGDIKQLIVENLDAKFLANIDVDRLVGLICESDYDYRPYFKVR